MIPNGPKGRASVRRSYRRIPRRAASEPLARLWRRFGGGFERRREGAIVARWKPATDPLLPFKFVPMDGCNAQEAGVPRQLGERVKSTQNGHSAVAKIRYLKQRLDLILWTGHFGRRQRGGRHLEPAVVEMMLLACKERTLPAPSPCTVIGIPACTVNESSTPRVESVQREVQRHHLRARQAGPRIWTRRPRGWSAAGAAAIIRNLTCTAWPVPLPVYPETGRLIERACPPIKPGGRALGDKRPEPPCRLGHPVTLPHAQLEAADRRSSRTAERHIRRTGRGDCDSMASN